MQKLTMDKNPQSSEAVGQVFSTLAQILSAQTAVMEKLVQLAESKTKAIMDDEAARIEVIAGEETTQVAQLQHLEEQRMRVVNWLEQQVSKTAGAPVHLGLADLVRIAPEGHGERMQQLGARLPETAERLSQLSDLNQKLLAHSLSVVNFSLDVLVGHQPSSGAYSKPRRKGEAPQKGSGARILDAKA